MTDVLVIGAGIAGVTAARDLVRAAEMTLSAHLPGSVDEIGVLGLLDDGVVKLETGLNHRIAAGYDSLPCFIAQDLDVRFGFTIETVGWSADGVRLRATDGCELSARARDVLEHGASRPSSQSGIANL
jgi:predicted NAD/FAD-dependent oxidoreductase